MNIMIIMQKLLTVVLSLAVVVVLTSQTQARRRRVNCRLYVFHPRCRGISAKRSAVETLFPVDDTQIRAYPEENMMYDSETGLSISDGRPASLPVNRLATARQQTGLTELLERLRDALRNREEDTNTPYDFRL